LITYFVEENNASIQKERLVYLEQLWEDIQRLTKGYSSGNGGLHRSDLRMSGWFNTSIALSLSIDQFPEQFI